MMSNSCALGISADVLSDWRSHLLDPREDERITEHVLECQACQVIIHQYGRMAKALQQLPTYPSGSAVWATLHLRTQTTPIPPYNGPLRMRFGEVAIVVVLLALFFFLMARQGVGSTSSQIPIHTPTIGIQTPTLLPSLTPQLGPFSGQPTYTSTLIKDRLDGWDTHFYEPGSSCQFESDGYHVATAPSYGLICANPRLDWSDFAVQVQMTFTKGTSTDWGGINFRGVGLVGEASYQFDVSANGHYDLTRCEAFNCSQTLVVGNATNFHQGLNQPNILGVVAQGSSISIYLNHDLLQTVTDSRYPKGIVGLFCGGNNDQIASEVVYQNFEEWAL